MAGLSDSEHTVKLEPSVLLKNLPIFASFEVELRVESSLFGLNDDVMNFLGMFYQKIITVEVLVAARNNALVELRLSVSTVVVLLITSGGESFVTIEAFVWFFSGVSPHVNHKVRKTPELAAAQVFTQLILQLL